MSLDRLQEKCGVLGIFKNKGTVGLDLYKALQQLQHRGQEAAGMATANRKKVYQVRGRGWVTNEISEDDASNLPGNIGIGQTKYTTQGEVGFDTIQPIVPEADTLALNENGNLTTLRPIKDFLSAQGVSFSSDLNDTGFMALVVNFFRSKGYPLDEAVAMSVKYFTGAYASMVTDKEKLVLFTDPCGVRPMSIGMIDDGFVAASETCALDAINAKFLREVNPGEMVVIDKTGIKSYQLQTPNPKFDIFEFIYFAKPESKLLDRNVGEVRKNLGRRAAIENPVKADIVIPVPSSSIPMAEGFSEASGIPFAYGLVKKDRDENNKPVGRTFILPGQLTREEAVRRKFNVIKEVVKGKRVILVDDSIVRGTTMPIVIKMLKEAGAIEVHLRICAPPVISPNFYGIATGTRAELIAHNKTPEEIGLIVGADSLEYLSFAGMISATGHSEERFETSCFTNNYPIDLGEHWEEVLQMV